MLKKDRRKPGRPSIEKITPQPIPATAFRAWQDGAGLSNNEAARRLGVSPNSIPAFRERGADGGTGLKVLALIAGFRSWSPAAADLARKAGHHIVALQAIEEEGRTSRRPPQSP